MDAMHHCRCKIVTIIALVFVVAIASTPAILAETPVPESRKEIQLSFAPLVKRVAPAVVNIYTKRVVHSRPNSPFFNDPMFRRFFGEQFSFPELTACESPRNLQDLWSGSVVLIERDDGVFREVLPESSEVVGTGSPPRVDRLIRITGHAQVSVLFGE